MTRVVPLHLYLVIYSNLPGDESELKKEYWAFTADDAITMWEHDSSLPVPPGCKLKLRSIRCVSEQK